MATTSLRLRPTLSSAPRRSRSGPPGGGAPHTLGTKREHLAGAVDVIALLADQQPTSAVVALPSFVPSRRLLKLDPDFRFDRRGACWRLVPPPGRVSVPRFDPSLRLRRAEQRCLRRRSPSRSPCAAARLPRQLLPPAGQAGAVRRRCLSVRCVPRRQRRA